MLGRNLEGLNDDEGDDGGHADLDEVAGDGGERHHPVAIDHDLGEVIADDLDGAGGNEGQDDEAHVFPLLGDGTHDEAHAADDD